MNPEECFVKVKVKTVWGNGMVSVGSPYVDQALNNEAGLLIDCKGAVMRVPYLDLLKKKPRNTVYEDKRTGRPYQLYDFYWKSE